MKKGEKFFAKLFYKKACRVKGQRPLSAGTTRMLTRDRKQKSSQLCREGKLAQKEKSFLPSFFSKKLVGSRGNAHWRRAPPACSRGIKSDNLYNSAAK
ncbi:MAG: hypothetical protein ACI4W6_06100 [Acutalibacteraceae bacterium]